jgi:hypothetical protein
VSPDSYAMLDLKSTMYKGDDEPVFVQVGRDHIQEISEISFAIRAYGDRPESEKVLVVHRHDDDARIFDIVRDHVFPRGESSESIRPPKRDSMKPIVKSEPPKDERRTG